MPGATARTTLGALALALAACATPAPPTCPQVAPSIPSTPASATASAGPSATPNPPDVSAEGTPGDRVLELREQAIDAWSEGDFTRAKVLFDALATRPDRRAFDRSLIASFRNERARRQLEAGLALSAIAAITLEAPGSAPRFAKSPRTAPRVSLTIVARHEGDTSAMGRELAKLDLLPRPDATLESLPESTPATCRGARLLRVFDSSTPPLYLFHRLDAREARLARAAAPGVEARVWELAPFVHGPGSKPSPDMSIGWAGALEGALYVESDTPYVDHAKAFLAAYDLATGKLVWRSVDRVANGHNVVLEDDLLFTTYSNATTSTLSAIDRATGEVRARAFVPGTARTVERHASRLVVTLNERVVEVEVRR